jgi:hypothetical protein
LPKTISSRSGVGVADSSEVVTGKGEYDEDEEVMPSAELLVAKVDGGLDEDVGEALVDEEDVPDGELDELNREEELG